MADKRFSAYAPMVKFDEKSGIVWFRITSETPDSEKMVMDYAKSKPRFLAHSERVMKASGGKSKFNVREQHNPEKAIGRSVDLVFRDAERDILAGVEIVDENSREKFAKGVLNGASIGGEFGERWKDPDNPGLVRFEAIPDEFSLVDVPANPDALPVKEFEFVRSDGKSEMRKFAKAEQADQADQPEDPIEKAVKIVEEKDPELAKSLKEKLSKADAGTDSAPDTPAMGAADEPEPDGDEMTPEACRAICLQVLEELGLVQKEGKAMTMAVKPGDLQKAADLLARHKTEVSNRLEEFGKSQKSLTDDLAKAFDTMADIDKRLSAVTGMGPIILDQGPEAANAFQIEMLRKAQDSAKTPLEAAKIGEQITKLEIQNIHKPQGQ